VIHLRVVFSDEYDLGLVLLT